MSDTPVHALIIADAGRAEHGRQRLLGLEVGERLVHNLQRHAVASIEIVGPKSAAAWTVRDAIRFAEDIDAEDAVAAIRTVAARDDDGDLLVLLGDLIVHPDLLPRLQEAAVTAERSQLVMDGPFNPVIYLRAGDRAALPEAADLPAFVAALRESGIAERYESDDAPFVVAATGEGQRTRAQRLLLATNWRPYDGIVARLINKHISVPISTRLADTPITPNHMTGAAFGIAVVGVVLAGLGTEVTFLMGAMLLQVQSILDGCDGELARMRYQSSEWGAWFDTVVDDILGVLWVGALGVGAARLTGHAAFGWVGLFAAVLYAAAIAMIYTAIRRAGGGGHQDFKYWFEEGSNPKTETPDLRKLSTWGKYVLKRDFYVLFFFVLAVFGWLPAASIVATVGAFAWFGVMVAHVAKRGLTFNA